MQIQFLFYLLCKLIHYNIFWYLQQANKFSYFYKPDKLEMFLFICYIFSQFIFQVTSALAAVWNNLREARGSEQCWNGLFHCNSLPHASLCYHVHCVFQLEDEQGPWIHHVPSILCFCCRITDV